MELLIGLAVVVVIIWTLFGRRKPGGGTRAFTSFGSSEVDRLHSEMLTMNLGDEAKVKRLVNFENEKNPKLSKVECYRAAIERLRRDLRR